MNTEQAKRITPEMIDNDIIPVEVKGLGNGRLLGFRYVGDDLDGVLVHTHPTTPNSWLEPHEVDIDDEEIAAAEYGVKVKQSGEIVQKHLGRMVKELQRKTPGVEGYWNITVTSTDDGFLYQSKSG